LVLQYTIGSTELRVDYPKDGISSAICGAVTVDIVAFNPLVVKFDTLGIAILSDDLSLVGTVETITFSTYLVDYPTSFGPNYLISIEMIEELREIDPKIIPRIRERRETPLFSIAGVNPTYAIDLADNSTTF